METVIQLLKDNFYTIGQIGISMELCAVSLLFLLLEKEKENNRYQILCMVLFVIVLNPMSYNNITTFWFFDDYWKLFLVGMPCVCVAYAFTELVCGGKSWWMRGGMLIACIVLVCLSNRFEFEVPRIEVPQNAYGVEDEIVELDKVLQSEEISLEKVIAPREVVASIREIDAEISLLYGEELIQRMIDGTYEKNDDERSYTEICASIVSVPSEVENQINIAELYGSNCIVLSKKYDNKALMKKNSFARIGMTENYVVYVKK